MSTPSLHLVVLGLSLSSSWGNGHATTYRALLKAFVARGHRVTFLEREAVWYAGPHRDLPDPEFCRLIFYDGLDDLHRHHELVRDADAVMLGSYVPQGAQAGLWVCGHAEGPVVFYDIDTPVTVAKLVDGELDYLSRDLITRFAIYFSFTGGPMLGRLEREFGAKCARALYCSVDADVYRPRAQPFDWDLSYLGTYSPDRQPTLERLLLEPARRSPQLRFAVAGPQYPDDIDWPANVERITHVAPADHPDFYARSRYTLNVTRADMIAAGYSPSVRLFEATACGAPVISDAWPGLDSFFTEGRDLFVALDADAVIGALGAPETARRALAQAGRERTLAAHTAPHRALELEQALREIPSPRVLPRNLSLAAS